MAIPPIKKNPPEDTTVVSSLPYEISVEISPVCEEGDVTESYPIASYPQPAQWTNQNIVFWCAVPCTNSKEEQANRLMAEPVGLYMMDEQTAGRVPNPILVAVYQSLNGCDIPQPQDLLAEGYFLQSHADVREDILVHALAAAREKGADRIQAQAQALALSLGYYLSQEPANPQEAQFRQSLVVALAAQDQTQPVLMEVVSNSSLSVTREEVEVLARRDLPVPHSTFLEVKPSQVSPTEDTSAVSAPSVGGSSSISTASHFLTTFALALPIAAMARWAARMLTGGSTRFLVERYTPESNLVFSGGTVAPISNPFYPVPGEIHLMGVISVEMDLASLGVSSKGKAPSHISSDSKIPLVVDKERSHQEVEDPSPNSFPLISWSLGMELSLEPSDGGEIAATLYPFAFAFVAMQNGASFTIPTSGSSFPSGTYIPFFNGSYPLANPKYGSSPRDSNSGSPGQDSRERDPKSGDQDQEEEKEQP